MGYVPLILVAEDDEVNRELIKDILEEYQYRVHEAVNGKDAVEKALAEVPDLILMDIEMPLMNGLQAIDALKNHPETNRVPIIVLTGLNETEDRIKAFDSGAMDFVAKPFNAHELLSHVRSYLRFSLINKKYVLSTLNPDTKLPNRAALREKLPEVENPILFLVKINNIEDVSRFYGENTGTEIERNFALFLMNREILRLGRDVTLFHLDKGLFGYLVSDEKKCIGKDEARQVASGLLEYSDAHQTIVKEVQYDLESTVVINFQKENLLEKSELVLDEAIRNKKDIMIVEDVIQDVYNVIGDNIFWLRKIKEAVQEERFTAFYQPILDGKTGKVVKYETLLRMVDENDEIVSPGKFLFIAKNSRYYHDITKIVTRHSIQKFENRSESFSINLSALDIENKGMRDFLLETLKESPQTASRMIFEIVEQEGVKHYEVLKDFFRDVKKFGVKIAIDDFGSGYSNYRMLMDMEVDFIKIDGSLIRNIHTDPTSRSVVESIKHFADKNNIGIIAEFVENDEIFQCLKKMGVQFFQGYFIGKPQKL